MQKRIKNNLLITTIGSDIKYSFSTFAGPAFLLRSADLTYSFQKNKMFIFPMNFL